MSVFMSVLMFLALACAAVICAVLWIIRMERALAAALSDTESARQQAGQASRRISALRRLLRGMRTGDSFSPGGD